MLPSEPSSLPLCGRVSRPITDRRIGTITRVKLDKSTELAADRVSVINVTKGNLWL